MQNEWARTLQSARERIGISRAELAHLASLSAETVRAVETGRRRPSRDTLDAIIKALKLDRWEANQIRYALGFAADYLRLGQVEPTFMFSLEELPQWVESVPWPVFVLDENVQVVVANSIVQKVWGVDLQREFLSPQERNLTSVATNRRFADRAANWDEMVAYNVAVWKGHHLGPESLDQPSAYFDAILGEVAKGDPKYVSRFLEIWQKTPPKAPKVRDRYRVVWRDPGHGEMRFLALSSTANEWEGLAFHDWVPVDAGSWEVLGRVIGA